MLPSRLSVQSGCPGSRRKRVPLLPALASSRTPSLAKSLTFAAGGEEPRQVRPAFVLTKTDVSVPAAIVSPVTRIANTSVGGSAETRRNVAAAGVAPARIETAASESTRETGRRSNEAETWTTGSEIIVVSQVRGPCCGGRIGRG